MENPTGMSFQKKALIIGAIVVALLVVLIVVLSGRARKTSGTPTGGGSQNPTGISSSSGNGELFNSGKKGPTPAATKLATNNEVSRVSLDWLGKQKNSKGVYYGQVHCDNPKTCDAPLSTYQTGVLSIWGRYNYYIKNKNKSDLAIILTDIATYSNKEKVPSIQNYFYNCKLMYDLWQSNDFNAAQKDQIKALCFNSQPFPPVEDAEKLQIDLNAVAKHQPINSTLSVNASNLIEYSTTVSDFVARYEWGQDVNDLNSAKDFLKSALLAYSKGNYADSKELPYLAMAVFDLYRVTKDASYLNLTYALYNDVTKKDCASIDMCTGMVYLAKKLYTVLPNPKYKDTAKKDTQILLDTYFDFPGYPAYKTGAGAFKPIESDIFSVQSNAFASGVILL